MASPHDPTPEPEHPDEDDPFPRWKRRLAEAEELLSATSTVEERRPDAEPER